MEFKKEKIEGLISFYPKVFGDDRGFFLESFNEEKYLDIIGVSFNFVQDNFSMSAKGVLRGLHFQIPPFEQGKLVQVTTGKAIDVAVDIRKDSPTYGQHVMVLLDSIQKNQLWIPPGFAHGFCALEDNTIFNYKCTNYYSPDSERSILWNDTDLQINWNIEDPTISAKDKQAMNFKDFISPF